MTTRLPSLLASQYIRRKLWAKRSRRFLRNKKVYFQLALCFFVLDFLLKLRPYPPKIPVRPETLKLPKRRQDVLQYAHEHAAQHELPVYLFYKARSGQLNNQLISFFNALAIAKEANATLVAPFAFYGSESYIDFEKDRGFLFQVFEAFDLYVSQAILKKLGLFYKHDELVGDYLDGALLNRTQPVVSMMQFLHSRGAAYLRSFPNVLARRGDASFFYMTLGKRSLFQENVNMRGEFLGEDADGKLERIASRRELDCNFNVSDYFRGLPFHGGVNGNFLFLSKLYRSHSLNCTSANPYWLKVRQYVQPRLEIRELVEEALERWGKVLALHLRLFPFDIGKFTTPKFCEHFLSQYASEIRKADRLYIAYSVSSKESIAIVAELRRELGETKVITAAGHGNLYSRGSEFNKRYSLPLVDMWTCVRSHYFVGRLGSSLSWNVAYWRDAFAENFSPRSHQFYRLEDFSNAAEKNPTDSYGF